jgi:hypothetical protein
MIPPAAPVAFEECTDPERRKAAAFRMTVRHENRRRSVVTMRHERNGNEASAIDDNADERNVIKRVSSNRCHPEPRVFAVQDLCIPPAAWVAFGECTDPERRKPGGV